MPLASSNETFVSYLFHRFLCCGRCLQPLSNWYDRYENRIAVYSTMLSFVASNILLVCWDTGSDIVTANHHFM